MAKPVLTSNEEALLAATKAVQEDLVTSYTSIVANQTSRIANLEDLDDAFKKFFDWYNDDIIGQYDTELKALTGAYQASPIVEADIEGPANLDSSVRTTPSLPVTDIIRIDEFDNDNQITANSYEQLSITEQAAIEDALVNGYGNPSGYSGTTVTTTDLDGSSTALSISDNTGAVTLSEDDIVILTGSGYQAAIRIDSITETTNPPATTPYTYNYAITVIIPPSGTISSGAAFTSFSGFSNGERSAKTASLQDLLDNMVSELEAAINSRITHLNTQLTAISANNDPDATAALSTASTNATTSKDFLTDYLVTTDISNTGLTTLSTERNTRGGQITARASAIDAAYTGQTINYFDRRYQLANARANTANGSLRLVKVATNAKNSTNNYKDLAQEFLTAIDDLLNE